MTAYVALGLIRRRSVCKVTPPSRPSVAGHELIFCEPSLTHSSPESLAATRGNVEPTAQGCLQEAGLDQQSTLYVVPRADPLEA